MVEEVLNARNFRVAGKIKIEDRPSRLAALAKKIEYLGDDRIGAGKARDDERGERRAGERSE